MVLKCKFLSGVWTKSLSRMGNWVGVSREMPSFIWQVKRRLKPREEEHLLKVIWPSWRAQVCLFIWIFDELIPGPGHGLDDKRMSERPPVGMTWRSICKGTQTCSRGYMGCYRIMVIDRVCTLLTGLERPGRQDSIESGEKQGQTTLLQTLLPEPWLAGEVFFYNSFIEM